MKKKEFLTEAKRKAIISDKEKAIIESFAKTFNKIKRIDENEISEVATLDDKLNQLFGAPINLIRTRNTRKSGELIKEPEEFKGTIGIVGKYDKDDTRMTPGFWVMNEKGHKRGFVMYDKSKGEFIEGDSATASFTYEAADEQSDRILKFILRYLVGANPINEFENELNENINTLGNILQNKGSLDHLKNNDRIRLKLIDGEFLKKNPEWKDRSLQFLFYDARSNMVGVELIGTGKSGNAYPEELVIDLEQTNINEFEEENSLYSRQQEYGINPEIEPEDLNQGVDIKEIIDNRMHPFFDFEQNKAYVELDDIDSVLVYDFEIGGTPINSQDPEVGYDGDISLTFNEDESQLNNGIDEYVNYIGDEISMNPDKYRFWEKYYDEGYGEPDEPDYY